jgi:hypothetical protein
VKAPEGYEPVVRLHLSLGELAEERSYPALHPLLHPHHAVTRCRYELLLYLLDEQEAEIQGTRMSIEFLVDAEAEEPYAGEVSVGCSAMPKVRCSARAAIAL